MPRSRLCLLLLSLAMLMALGCDDTDEASPDTVASDAGDQAPDGTAGDTAGAAFDPSKPCADDGLCNNSDECGGGSPKDWTSTTDPDCPTCTCNYYPGICEAASAYSDEACPCDWDCRGGLAACDSDGYCDSWCPDENTCPDGSGLGSVDPDCGGCNCNYYCGICEPWYRCSTEVCYCDPDCQPGQLPCGADDHCDSWCPTGVDPDCEGSPNDGKYCQ